MPLPSLAPRRLPVARHTHRRDDPLLRAAREVAAAHAERSTTDADARAHAHALVALREAAHAYTRRRDARGRARVWAAARALDGDGGVRAADVLGPALRDLERVRGFREATPARRREAARELAGLVYRAGGRAGAAALLAGAAYHDLEHAQRARLVAHYGAHTRGSVLWRLRVALEPHHESRRRDTARRVALAAREVLAPVDAELAHWVAHVAFEAPEEPPLRDYRTGVPVALARLHGGGGAGAPRSALAALLDAVREAAAV